jgi:hypothetical protein
MAGKGNKSFFFNFNYFSDTHDIKTEQWILHLGENAYLHIINAIIIFMTVYPHELATVVKIWE